jgi:hypothetical protein
MGSIANKSSNFGFSCVLPIMAISGNTFYLLGEGMCFRSSLVFEPNLL